MSRYLVWWAAVQRDWHRRKALRLYRWAEVHARESKLWEEKAALHERRAKHLQLQVTKLRIISR